MPRKPSRTKGQSVIEMEERNTDEIEYTPLLALYHNATFFFQSSIIIDQRSSTIINDHQRSSSIIIDQRSSTIIIDHQQSSTINNHLSRIDESFFLQGL
jgi:hypothetical protein